MNVFDTKPCENETKKLKITCGEVYVLMIIIDCCKKIFSSDKFDLFDSDLIDLDLIDLDLFDSDKLDINKLHNIIPQILKPLKIIINQESIYDIFYFYLSSLDDKIEKFIKNNYSKMAIDDFCVISRKKCDTGLLDFSLQYKVCMYIKEKLSN